MAPDAQVVVLVFAKAPIPGKVKTRLMPSLDAKQACDVHVALLERTLAVACRAFSPARVQLWAGLEPTHPTLEALAACHGIARHAQSSGDLGRRMHAALCAQQGPALLIGSDCPVLTPILLARCARALVDHDLVLLPAEDGGYALIGGVRPHCGVFEAIEWGGRDVTAQTLERARALGLHVACPETVWDIDTPRDLERWRNLDDST
ncbi:TIGR04282 family arsenosugar biosynthesis glycosyltransferase [Modicisalibacter tunisiensis]|uniref:TIGR04282 family arsenosugar biosynthesis glycosyltransferase n=2 Tax=Modicisalibacter tunisiensis TaxID=390637 RepID=A0ABS7WZ02_9GAMM|nr:TIGR04282 family arsenosugar biosynthesis glycosyltransferase [Modicisalibacter tunisiensis]MBZ9566977.1 TIGR04282 family arsenosugar biosynthesis glycosyltransferase [Modicisalibacter tunisiensis]